MGPGVSSTSPDPAALDAWYTQHLGPDPGDHPGAGLPAGRHAGACARE